MLDTLESYGFKPDRDASSPNSDDQHLLEEKVIRALEVGEGRGWIWKADR